MSEKEIFLKIKLLADNMYFAMQNLINDTKSVRQAMDEYRNFIIFLGKENLKH